MAKRELALSADEIGVVLKIKGYVSAFLFRDFSYGILNETDRNNMKSLESQLNKLIPKTPGVYAIIPKTFGSEGETTKGAWIDFRTLLSRFTTFQIFNNKRPSKTKGLALDLICSCDGYSKLY